MQHQIIDGIELNRIFNVGYRNLKKNMTAVNDLNVFPVPDGDTGTNMVHTFGGGIKAVGDGVGNVGEYMGSLSRAVLLSARGNSGVIFSQFIHGLYRGFADKETIEFADFANAFVCATEDSYKSIITPTEGTILTVIREAAEYLKANASDYEDFKAGFAALIPNMKSTLSKTPDLLPVLKEAGVVDSGGAGLVCFFEGVYAGICGEDVEDTPDLIDSISQSVISGNFGPDSVLEYGYCTEFILQLMNAKTDIKNFSKDEFIKPLEEMGDSIVVVVNDSIVKIHIHTFTPEKVLQYARAFGEFVTIKIENMSVQHSEVEAAPTKKEHVKYAVVAVAAGEGIIDYFYGIGATVVINGGQTNNPSVDAFLEAFDTFDAEHIIVLPNNSNIILTAKQAAEMYNGDVHIIPTKSIVEGYSALSMMNLWCDTVDELISDMSMGLASVTTGYVTTATRDTVMNGLEIKKDKYIGIENKNILICSDDKIDTAFSLIKDITSRVEKEVIIVFYGASVTTEEAEGFKAELEKEYPLADIGFIEGKQDVYDFIISLE